MCIRDSLTRDLGVSRFRMFVHPFVEAYIRKGLFSLYSKWRREFGRGFKIIPDESLAYLQYRVLDPDNHEIDLKEESDINSSQSKTRAKVKNRDKEEN